MSYEVWDDDTTPDYVHELCTSRSEDGFKCTLDARFHDPYEHAAGDGQYIVAVWPV